MPPPKEKTLSVFFEKNFLALSTQFIEISSFQCFTTRPENSIVQAIFLPQGRLSGFALPSPVFFLREVFS